MNLEMYTLLSILRFAKENFGEPMSYVRDKFISTYHGPIEFDAECRSCVFTVGGVTGKVSAEVQSDWRGALHGVDPHLAPGEYVESGAVPLGNYGVRVGPESCGEASAEAIARTLIETYRNLNIAHGIAIGHTEGLIRQIAAQYRDVIEMAERITALEAKCDLLSASVRRAEATLGTEGPIRQIAAAIEAGRHRGAEAMRKAAAQLAFDQTSDDPAPGGWNDACEHVAAAIRALPMSEEKP